MNEVWIMELAGRLHLGEKAGPLMERLSAWILEKGPALNEAFAIAGLGAKLSSWLGEREKHSMTAEDVRKLLGAEWIADTAGELGLKESDVELGAAEGLPFLLKDLGPSLPVAVAPAGVKVPASAATTAVGTGKGAMEWLAYVAVFAAITLGVGFGMRGCAGVLPPEKPHVASHGEGDHGAETHDAEEHSQVPEMLTPDHIGDMGIEGQDAEFDHELFGQIAELLKGKSGILTFGKEMLQIAGTVAAGPERDALEAKIRELLHGREVKFLWTEPAPKIVVRSNTAAAAALDKLGDAFTPAQLTDALNLSSINFETGMATISADSKVILEKAAAAIKKSKGTRIEVGGHTDNVGDPAANQTLSEDRAKAAMASLVGMGVEKTRLVAKGYGDRKPVVPNDSEKNRAANRRMQFTALK